MMSQRNNFTVTHKKNIPNHGDETITYVGLSKLLGKQIVEIVGEPNLYDESFSISGIIFDDGTFLDVETSYDGAEIYDNQLLNLDVLKSCAEQYELDDYEEENSFYEEEIDDDWDDDDTFEIDGELYVDVDRARLF